MEEKEEIRQIVADLISNAGCSLASITVILAMILDELAKINRKLSKPEV